MTNEPTLVLMSPSSEVAVARFVRHELRWYGGLVLGLVVVVGAVIGWAVDTSVDSRAEGELARVREKLVSEAEQLTIHIKDHDRKANTEASQLLGRVTVLAESVEAVQKRSTELLAKLVELEKQSEALRQQLRTQEQESGLDGIVEGLWSKYGEQIRAASDVQVPVGSIVAWPTEAALPSTSWRDCDGSSVQVTSKSDPLYEALGTTYGAKQGHVVLPSFEGRFLRGAGGDAAKVGVPQQDSVGPHTHEVDLGIYNVARYDNGGDTDGDPNGSRSHQIHVKGETKANAGSETRPKNFAVRWIIRKRPTELVAVA